MPGRWAKPKDLRSSYNCEGPEQDRHKECNHSSRAGTGELLTSPICSHTRPLPPTIYIGCARAEWPGPTKALRRISASVSQPLRAPVLLGGPGLSCRCRTHISPSSSSRHLFSLKSITLLLKYSRRHGLHTSTVGRPKRAHIVGAKRSRYVS